MSPGGARALVVEDDRSWQMILSELLEDAGLVVDVADSLETATTYLRVYPHRLAVVDLSLTGDNPHNKDGLAVLDVLRLHDPGCVTMLLTGFATVELAVSVLTEYNAFTCLRKEVFQRAQFRDLINRALMTAQSPSLVRGEAPPSQDESLFDKGAPASHGKSQPGSAAVVVEDDAGWRSILFELLVDAGFQVRTCSGYGEALGCLRRDKFSLAVIDLSLAGPAKGASAWEQSLSTKDLEGYRLLTSTRANGIPTIVVSGVANPADIERAYQEQGIFAYIEKQAFDRRAFLTIVAESQSAGRSSSEIEKLTEREREVLDLLSQGMTNKEIADILFISTNTVKRHLKAIFSKLDIHTRSAAAAKALNSSD